MPKQVVSVTYQYEAETPEAAEEAVRKAEALYEGTSLVTAASSLGELSHPSQLRGAEAFGQ